MVDVLQERDATGCKTKTGQFEFDSVIKLEARSNFARVAV